MEPEAEYLLSAFAFTISNRYLSGELFLWKAVFWAGNRSAGSVKIFLEVSGVFVAPFLRLFPIPSLHQGTPGRPADQPAAWELPRLPNGLDLHTLHDEFEYSYIALGELAGLATEHLLTDGLVKIPDGFRRNPGLRR